MKAFNYYFIQRNGLWKEKLKEYEQLGSKDCSAIAKLIHACEIGEIDQHASEDLKAVSSVIAALEAEIAILKERK